MKIFKLILVIILLLGFSNIVHLLGEDWLNYTIPFLIVTISLIITLVLLKNKGLSSIPVLIVILVFMFAYFVRFFFVVSNPVLVYFLVPSSAWSAFDNPNVLEISFIYLSIAFVTFCISATYFKYVSNHMRKLKSVDNLITKPKRVPSYLFIIIAMLSYIVIDTLFISRGIGKMGTFVENPLPFKLTGLLIYMKSLIIPFILILHIYWAKQFNRNKLAAIGVVVIFLSGIFDMFVFESRGLFLVQAVTVGLVWILAGFKINKVATIAILVTILGYLFSVPIVVALRHKIPLDSLTYSQIIDGFNFVFFRVTGIDQFMVIYDLGEPIPLDRIWDVLSSSRGIAGYYTTELLGYADDIPQTFAPSFFGFLYLLGGLPAIVFGSLTLGFLVTFMWDSFHFIFPKTEPVIKSYFIIQVGFSITEGPSKTAFTSFIVVALCAWLSEKTFSIKTTRFQTSHECNEKIPYL